MKPVAVRMYYLTLLTIFSFSSCQSKSEKNIETINAAEKAISQSNSLIRIGTLRIINELRDKTDKPESRERALTWLPKAEHINLLTTQLYEKIEKNKTQLEINSSAKRNLSDLKLLVDVLFEHRQSITYMLPEVNTVFSTKVFAFMDELDSLKKTNYKYLGTRFNLSSTAAIRCNLTQFQNDIIIAENNMIAFCNTNVRGYDEFFYSYSAIVGQSSNYVRAGETIDITAGVGAFCKKPKPDIVINGKKMEIGDDGAAMFTFTAPARPGKHYVPVTINFISYFGTKEKIEKVVEYTVAPLHLNNQ